MSENCYCPVCNRGRTNHHFSITFVDRLKFKIRHWLRKKADAILGGRGMKAYKVWDDKCDGNSIVFAENIKEAKKIAIHTDVCEEADFIDIRVKRYECADVLYKGKSEIDWYDEGTRLTLVRDFGWVTTHQMAKYCTEKVL